MDKTVKQMIEKIDKEIAGGKILKAIVNDDRDFYGFSVITKKGKIINVWVDADREGSGPGFLNIEKPD